MTSQDAFEVTGRVWLRSAVSDVDRAELEALLGRFEGPGNRPCWNSAYDKYLGAESAIGRYVRTLVPNAVPVRILSFNKSQSVNWGVPWHQDRIIAVKERADVRGFSSWSRKSEFWHVEPPESILASMLFVRMHLDSCPKESGPMEMALGSHRFGRVSSGDASELANNCEIDTGEAKAGDVLISKALTLHRSISSELNQPRRAIRVDYADPVLLPTPLKWALYSA